MDVSRTETGCSDFKGRTEAENKTKVWAFKKGDLVFESKPYAIVVSGRFVDSRCHFCFGASSNMQRCSVCKFSRYCSKQCQKDDWGQHKSECKTIDAINLNASPFQFMDDEIDCKLRLFGRVMRRYQLEKTNVKSTEVILDRSRDINMLRSNLPKSKDDCPQLFAMLHELFSRCASTIQNSKLPLLSKDEVNGVIAKTLLNSTSIVREEVTYGRGVYLGGSALPHSCTPNAVLYFKGTTMQVYSLKKIEVNRAEDVFVSYILLKRDTVTRQGILWNEFFYDCHCKKCSDPEVAILEHKNSFKTPERKSQFEKAYADYQSVTHKMVDNSLFGQSPGTFQSRQQQLLQMAETFLKNYPEIQFYANVDYFDLLDMCCTSSMLLNKTEKMLDYGLKTLPFYAFYCGTDGSGYAIQLIKVEGFKVVAGKQTPDSRANVQLALANLSITKGENMGWYFKSEMMWNEMN